MNIKICTAILQKADQGKNNRGKFSQVETTGRAIEPIILLFKCMIGTSLLKFLFQASDY